MKYTCDQIDRPSIPEIASVHHQHGEQLLGQLAIKSYANTQENRIS